MDGLIKDNIEISDGALLISKGLANTNDLTNRYYTLYKNYKALIDKFLVEKLKLKAYDQSIDDTGLRFIPVENTNMDYYQYISTTGLKYLYLRNNLYVEKLSKEDINRIISLTEEDLKNPSEELMKFVEDTYKMVIDRSPRSDGTYMTRYGPDNDKFWFSSEELILGLRYDIFADNGLGEDEEWQENNEKQIMFIQALRDEINNTSRGMLGIPVNVIMYTDYTIKETVNLRR